LGGSAKIEKSSLCPYHRLAAEFLSTFWLVFGGWGAAVLAAKFPSTPFVGIGFASVALAFGLTLLAMAFAVGHISDAHFNPAVTAGAWAAALAVLWGWLARPRPTALGSPTDPWGAARRWVLCAYSGARVGELIQLRGQEIEQRAGDHVLRITPDAGTVKTGKARTVPIHPHLVEMGLVDYVEAVKARLGKQGPRYSSGLQRDLPAAQLRGPAVKSLTGWVRELGGEPRNLSGAKIGPPVFGHHIRPSCCNDFKSASKPGCPARAR
jgi:hypothetical protein